MTLTPARIEGLKTALALASPAPWRACGASNGRCACGLVWHPDEQHLVFSTTPHDDAESQETALPLEQRTNDKLAIVALRNAATELLAVADEANRLRALLAEARVRIPRTHELASRIDDALSSPTAKAGE